MGLEKMLKEQIPEITNVIQIQPNVPDITIENVDSVLETIRPFLDIAGGKISVVEITGLDIIPQIKLKMIGSAANIRSIKVEIVQRINRHFNKSTNVEWID